MHRRMNTLLTKRDSAKSHKKKGFLMLVKTPWSPHSYLGLAQGSRRASPCRGTFRVRDEIKCHCGRCLLALLGLPVTVAPFGIVQTWSYPHLLSYEPTAHNPGRTIPARYISRPRTTTGDSCWGRLCSTVHCFLYVNLALLVF